MSKDSVWYKGIWKKFSPLKNISFPQANPPSPPPPPPAAVYIMNAAPGLYNKIILSKGKLFNKGFCYLHNDVDSHYPKKMKFFVF